MAPGRVCCGGGGRGSGDGKGREQGRGCGAKGVAELQVRRANCIHLLYGPPGCPSGCNLPVKPEECLVSSGVHLRFWNPSTDEKFARWDFAQSPLLDDVGQGRAAKDGSASSYLITLVAACAVPVNCT